MIQRLYSSFPDSWPGAGLLLLRLAIGVPAVVSAIWEGSTAAQAAGLVSSVLGLICGGLILFGLWTPVAAVALALVELSSVFAGHTVLHLAMALLPLCLAMLGPGAWSIDARIYGRKRIRV